MTAILFSPYMFCAVKYALVRQTVAPLIYGLAIALSVVLFVCPRLKRQVLIFCLGGWCICQVLCLPSFMSGIDVGSFPFGVNPKGILRTLFLKREMARANSLTCKKVCERDIKKEWRVRIGKGTVLFVPDEMGPAMAPDTQFTIVPLPSMQMYSACHPYLDGLNAALINSVRAPDWIVCATDAGCNGGLVNYPRFWSAVLSKYEYEDESSQYVLLRRRMAPASLFKPPAKSFSPGKCGHVQLPVGCWIEMYSQLVSNCSVEWRRTIVGRFCGMFLRSATCFMQVRYDDGELVRFIFIPDNTRGFSFDISKIPATTSDFIRLLKGEPIRQPVAIRFEATTPSHFCRMVVIDG